MWMISLTKFSGTWLGPDKAVNLEVHEVCTTITMSRALDPETASSISSGDAQKIYNDISKGLSCTESLIEIEFIGKSHPLPPGTNILVDGQNIGVSKVKLVQAFLVARKILFSLLKDCPDDKISDLQNATAVILLMDPEHLTVSFLVCH